MDGNRRIDLSRKVKWLKARTRDDHAEVMATTLNQKRYDAAGNRLPGYDNREIAAMSGYEREQVKARGWLGQHHRDHISK